jgi:hypothetical protein
MDYRRYYGGIILIVSAALILLDGFLGSIETIDIELLSLPNFKVVIGFIVLVLVISFLQESRKK